MHVFQVSGAALRWRCLWTNIVSFESCISNFESFGSLNEKQKKRLSILTPSSRDRSPRHPKKRKDANEAMMMTTTPDQPRQIINDQRTRKYTQDRTMQYQIKNKAHAPLTINIHIYQESRSGMWKMSVRFTFDGSTSYLSQSPLNHLIETRRHGENRCASILDGG